ncbi:Crp/Fnr family transcriptional regulator [Amycolatopsis sp. lyj-108]|uniref:Crp/Fnr family transcriptional regulator n=1 Tax=Amycolatopsis sp. lyj-108 TaxID=2789286 RepID=UPI00397D3EC2
MISETGRVDGAPRSTFASRLGRVALSDFRKLGTTRKFAAGDQLFMEGDAPGNVFLVESGSIRVYMISPAGTELILGFRGAGDLLCETSALEGIPRSTCGTGRVDGEVTEISRSAFRSFIRRHPEAMAHVFSVIRDRLRDSDQERLSYASESVAARVSRKLASWADMYGSPQPGGRVVIRGFSRKELAQSVAAAEKSVDEVLVALRAAGLISTGRLQIVMNDPHRLLSWPLAQS